MTRILAALALLLFTATPQMFAQADASSDTEERTPEDAFEWLQGKMETFKFDNYYGSGRKRYREIYKYEVVGFEGCTVKISQEYKYIRQINSAKDDSQNTKIYTINFADIASLTDNSDSYKPSYLFTTRNEMDKIAYRYDYSDNSYNTSAFRMYIDDLGELTDEPERLINALQFVIDKCKPAKKKEKF